MFKLGLQILCPRNLVYHELPFKCAYCYWWILIYKFKYSYCIIFNSGSNIIGCLSIDWRNFLPRGNRNSRWSFPASSSWKMCFKLSGKELKRWWKEEGKIGLKGNLKEEAKHGCRFLFFLKGETNRLPPSRREIRLRPLKERERVRFWLTVYFLFISVLSLFCFRWMWSPLPFHYCGFLFLRKVEKEGAALSVRWV